MKYRLTDLSELFCTFFLRQFFVRFDESIQGSLLHIFHDQINILVIVETSVQLHKIGMLQKKANFDLLYKLIQHQTH